MRRERRATAEAVLGSQKSCAVSKAAVIQEISENLKYCWECQQKTQWLPKSRPVLGSSLSTALENKAQQAPSYTKQSQDTGAAPFLSPSLLTGGAQASNGGPELLPQAFLNLPGLAGIRRVQ